MLNIAQIDYNDKSVDGVLGTQTGGGRMVGADESTELWRHPQLLKDLLLGKIYFKYWSFLSLCLST